MSYYFVSITIRWFKEAIHQNVDIFWDKVACSSNGTIPGMPHVNPYVLRVKIQATRAIYPAPVTNPTLHGVKGGLLKKSPEPSSSYGHGSNTYNMVHTVQVQGNTRAKTSPPWGFSSLRRARDNI